MAKALWTCTALAACLVILSGSVAEAIDRSRSRATAAGSPKRKKGKVVGLNGTSHVFERARLLRFVLFCCLIAFKSPRRICIIRRRTRRARKREIKNCADFDFLRPRRRSVSAKVIYELRFFAKDR
jgi:hypothetical protein